MGKSVFYLTHWGRQKNAIISQTTFSTAFLRFRWSLFLRLQCPKPQIYISLVDATWKHPKYTCFQILPLEFGVNINIYKHENSEILYSNHNKSQTKMSGNSRLQMHGKMLIDFIWRNVQAKYLMQTILCHFKWDMAPWKWPMCPQYMQWTWWKTVTTQHKGLTYWTIFQHWFI